MMAMFALTATTARWGNVSLRGYWIVTTPTPVPTIPVHRMWAASLCPMTVNVMTAPSVLKGISAREESAWVCWWIAMTIRYALKIGARLIRVVSTVR
jgi:hypothetical protein